MKFVKNSWCALVVALVMAVSLGGTAHAAKGKLGVSMATLAGPWYTAILYGITSKAEELGYDVVVLDGGGYENVENQISQVSNLIVQKVDALLIDPANPDAFNGVALQAKQAGIPVIGVATPIVGRNVPVDGAASSSHCQVGKALAEGVKGLIPNGGKMAVLEGPPGAYWATERLRCFLLDIEGSGIETLISKSTIQDTATSLSTVNDFLQLHPNLDVIYAPGDSYGVGAARAVQQIGKCGEVKVFNAVFGETAGDMMKQGCIHFIAAQLPVEIGQDSVEIADGLITGKFKSGDEMRISGALPITPETMDTFDLSPIRPPVGWRPSL